MKADEEDISRSLSEEIDTAETDVYPVLNN